MNTPDEFYFSGVSVPAPGQIIEFGFNADLVQIINDGLNRIRCSSRGADITNTTPEIYPGELMTLDKTSGQRLRITVGSTDGTTSAFRVYAFR